MSDSDYTKIAEQAEADLNTYQAKTGEARPQGLADAGVNTVSEKKFPSSEVSYGDDLNTNSGFNRRIPPSEGGVLDDKGRAPTGQQYEGFGGPMDKVNRSYERQPGQDDNDVVPANVSMTSGLGSADDIASQGQAAQRANVGKNPPGPGGDKYPEATHDSSVKVDDPMSAEGYVAPESAVEMSEEAKQGGPPNV